jgi:hypothetical protein
MNRPPPIKLERPVPRALMRVRDVRNAHEDRVVREVCELLLGKLREVAAMPDDIEMRAALADVILALAEVP